MKNLIQKTEKYQALRVRPSSINRNKDIITRTKKTTTYKFMGFIPLYFKNEIEKYYEFI